MSAFFNIMWKNFKLLFRAKSSALVIFLGPLLVVTLIGLAFSNTGAYDVNIGVYSSSYSQLANDLLGKFNESRYQVSKINSETECINSVKRGENNLCVVFPPNFDYKTSPELNFHVDYSQINLVYAVLDVIGQEVGKQKTEITESLANELLAKIAEAKTTTDQAVSDIAAVKAKISEASAKALDIKTKLISLQVYDVSQINIATIESNVNSISDGLKKVSTAVNDAKKDVEGLTSSPEQTAALAHLSSAIADLATARNIIKANVSNVSTTSLDLKKLITQAKGKLANATVLLNQLRTNKNNYANELDGVKTKLDESISGLTSLEKKNSDLKASLSGLTVASAETITTPIQTKIHSVVSESTYFNFIFSTLIVMIIMITSILLASTMIMSEKKSQAFFRNYVTPVGDATFNAAMFATSFIVIIVQLILFLGVSELFFQTKIAPSILASSVVLILTTAFFIYLGMLIGYMFKSDETNTLASISISSLMLFLSSAVLPMQSMPENIRAIAGFNPFVLAETTLRKTIFFNFNIPQIQSELLLLVLYTIILIILTFIVQKSLRHTMLFHIHQKKPAGFGKKKEE